jgi:hypothetical protein
VDLLPSSCGGGGGGGGEATNPVTSGPPSGPLGLDLGLGF